MISHKQNNASGGKLFLACLVAVTFSLWSEAAAAQCKVMTNDWDENFGRLLLGEDIKSERAKLLKPCPSAGQCALMDESGIEYSTGDAGTVAVKGLDLNEYAGSMPFGINRNDNIEQVRKKLFSQPDVVDQTLQSTDGSALISHACFTNSKHVAFSILVTFDADGKMTGAGIATEKEYRRTRELIDALRSSDGNMHTAEPTYDCRKDSHVVDQCFDVRGRLERGANSRITLWPVGTKHLLGVQYPGDMPEVGGQFVPLPTVLQSLIDQNWAVTGDFLVCPFTPEKPGVKQYVCIATASNLKSHPQN